KIPDWFNSIILRAISVDEERRYKSYSHLKYELENPTKVKPFFEKNAPLLEKSPEKFYKIGFYLLLILNFILFLKISSN
ncbi:MAG: bifunctional protein-serine/threonine kinase/phosphatase, partial [Arcobacter sp.]